VPRQLKPQSLGFYENQDTRVRVELFLDRNEHNFFAKFGGEQYYGESKNDLIEHLKKVIKESVNITWAPVIEVVKMQPWSSYYGRDEAPAFVGIGVRRFYYGRLQDGTYVTVQWDIPEDKRTNFRQNLGWGRDQEFVPPCTRGKGAGGGSPDTFFLPYDEVIWLALNQLVENIRAVRRKLDGMLSSAEGIDRLVQMLMSGPEMKMLGPGEED
jgi:hypothetical protein